MISFESDYIAGAHPRILERLVETNMECLTGYGSDIYSDRAKEKIKEFVGLPDAQIYLTVGGTQTNQVVISTVLADYEGVVAATTGHVAAHESGAIEFTGHKVLTIPGHMGKIDAGELDSFIAAFYADENHEHMVFPGMVYISFPTEYGSVYTKAELSDISGVCRKYNIPLYIDGARLGYGLASSGCDVTIKDIAEFADVFYIGGTKVGALCGEAIVFTKNNMPKYFLTQAKRRGALLAKGRLLGLMFDTLFTDDLYMNVSRHAIKKAEELKEIIREKGYTFFYETTTNQQFLLLTNEQYDRLKNEVAMGFWEKPDDEHTVVRLATSWSTTDEDIEVLRRIL